MRVSTLTIATLLMQKKQCAAVILEFFCVTVPANPKIYHIVHVDRLASIVADGYIYSDADMLNRNGAGTNIGMGHIKTRRLTELELTSRPGLKVGECTPFYFCSRSVMLYLIYMRNAELAYKGGQQPIVHLEADLNTVAAWANTNGMRWAFTLSNAGARYFEDRSDLADLDQLDWDAIGADSWASKKHGKQAEFLLERALPWQLVERIGVFSQAQVQAVGLALANNAHHPTIEIKRDWYY